MIKNSKKPKYFVGVIIVNMLSVQIWTNILRFCKQHWLKVCWPWCLNESSRYRIFLYILYYEKNHRITCILILKTLCLLINLFWKYSYYLRVIVYQTRVNVHLVSMCILKKVIYRYDFDWRYYCEDWNFEMNMMKKKLTSLGNFCVFVW